MSRRSFERLLSLIEPHMHGGIHTEETRATRHTRARDTRAEMTTTPTMAFRLAAVLYLFAHGGALQLTAHVASIGRSTLRAWAVLFCNAAMRAVHPIYMPYGPPPPAVLHHNRREFASRRGIQNIAMCVDGTHIPWRPYKVAHRSEYRNYKGWYSILCVAFVSPFHLFIDGDVGYPGRAGDNTVLNNSPLMDAIHADPEAWLGRDGLIIGDGGASDGDRCFLNPYHTPRTPQRCWFNFCHSSTRFYVEEVFGRWKNRWRFLLNPVDTTLELQCSMVYASMILYNFVTIERRRESRHRQLGVEAARVARNTSAAATLDEFDGSAAAWASFQAEFASERCPSCVGRGARVCLHMARNRNPDVAGDGADGRPGTSTAHDNMRRAPSEVRDRICDELWTRQLYRRGRRGVLTLDDTESALAEEAGVIVEQMQNLACRTRGDDEHEDPHM